MTGTPVKYRTPSLSPEDQADVHEAGVGGDELCLTTQTKWTYFLLGCAILLPFNALFNTTSFFLSRLAGSPYYPTFSSYLSSVYTWTKLVCQFHCTFTSKQSSPSRRIFTSIVAMILLVTSLCFSTFVRGAPSAFFAFALFNAAAMAVAASYLSTAVYGGAALLGAPFLQVVISGQTVIAVAVSAVQVASSIIALWGSSSKSNLPEAGNSERDDRAEEIAARIFFSVSAAFLCVTLVAYAWLTKQQFHKSATAALERRRRGIGVVDEYTGLIADDRRNASSGSKSHVYRVFRENLIFMFSLAYVFIVTLSVYPVITARIRPVNPGIHPMLFTAVHFLVANFGSFVGQYSCSFPRFVVWSGEKILAMSLLRTFFIPLFLLCNVDRSGIAPLIRSDILFMILTLMLGYTYGYVFALALLAVSSLEHNPRLKGRREDVDIAATLASSCMILGLALGSLASFGTQAMI